MKPDPVRSDALDPRFHCVREGSGKRPLRPAGTRHAGTAATSTVKDR